MYEYHIAIAWWKHTFRPLITDVILLFIKMAGQHKKDKRLFLYLKLKWFTKKVIFSKIIIELAKPHTQNIIYGNILLRPRWPQI